MIGTMTNWFLQGANRWKRSPRLAGVRKVTNLLHYDPHRVSLSLTDLGDDSYIVVDGCKYYVRDQSASGIRRVNLDPDLTGLRSTDVVLDIGAYIGCVTVPMAKMAKWVYAVEPLFYEELWNNVVLNGLDNVTVEHLSLSMQRVSYDERDEPTNPTTLLDLRRLCGRVDFLKMNCEGGEWYVRPDEYGGIRELRIEYHVSRVYQRGCEAGYKLLISWLEAHNYDADVVFAKALSATMIGSYRIRASLKE